MFSDSSRFAWRDGGTRVSLPIDDSLPEICEALNRNRLLFVQAKPGAGKTTRMPPALLDSGVDTIFMTQPTRSAVRMNGRRIAYEMGVEPGTVVGWTLRAERPMVSSATRLHLMVDSALVNRIRLRGALPEGVLIIDEAHIRRISIDLLLALIKELLPSSPNTKVIITSATMDSSAFLRFFGEGEVISVPGRCFPVQRDVLRLNYAEHHSEGAARAAREKLMAWAEDRLLVPELGLVREGAILVLLPGKEDIQNVLNSVRRLAESLNLSDRVELLAYHRESSADTEEALSIDVKPGTLRFVAATELARSSVTVPGVIGVIDSLQVNRWIVDPKGVAHFTKIAVSRADSEQAAGRAGRTQPGFYVAVSFGTEYENLAAFAMPEILQAPITSAVLQVAAIGRSLRTMDLMTRPEVEKIDLAVKRLIRVDALDEKEQITERGQLLLRIPLDPERAVSLVEAARFGVIPEAMIVLASRETDGVFFNPAKARMDDPYLATREQVDYIRKEDALMGYFGDGSFDPKREIDSDNLPSWAKEEGEFYRISFAPVHRSQIVAFERRRLADSTMSDFVAIVNLYREFRTEELRLVRAFPKAHQKQLDKLLYAWCEAHNAHFQNLRKVTSVIWMLEDDLRGTSIQLPDDIVTKRRFDADALTKSFLAGHTHNLAMLGGGDRYRGPLGEFVIGRNSAASGVSLVVVASVQKIPLKIRGGGTVLLPIADIAAEVQMQWLPELMPQLCSVSHSEPPYYDSHADRVYQRSLHEFDGYKIGETVDEVQGDAAQQAFARWVCNDGDYYLPPSYHAVLTMNERAFRATRELNRRAGAKHLPDDPRSFYEERLKGATCMAQLPLADELVLVLDREQLRKLEEENPDNLNFAGYVWRIFYDDDLGPMTELPQGLWQSEVNSLPDGAITLPGGREVLITPPGLQASVDNLRDAKCYYGSPLVRDWFFGLGFETFPEPNESDPLWAELPPIAERKHDSGVTGYGVLVAVLQNWAPKPYYYTKWFASRRVAERTHRKSVEVFNAYMEPKREAARQELAAKSPTTLKSSLDGLIAHWGAKRA